VPYVADTRLHPAGRRARRAGAHRARPVAHWRADLDAPTSRSCSSRAMRDCSRAIAS